jgi:signal transduction histidine kinase
VADINHVGLLERYRRLSEISIELASTLDLDALLNNIVHAAADLLEAEAASVLLYDEIKQVLYFDAASNLTEPLMRGLIVPVDSSIAGWIVTNRKPIIVSDTQKDPRHYGDIAKSTQVTTNSMLGVPLIAKDKVVGVLEAINKLSGEFNEEDQNVLLALGALVAVAIENARLFQQTDLISEMVHEVRTPLTSLGTAARLLLRPQISDEMRQRMAEIILTETSRLSEMTTAFLDLARLESGRVQFQAKVFEMPALLEECCTLMRSKADERSINLELSTRQPLDADLPPIKADRDKIKQVLINLLSNAIKYNRPGGEIFLAAHLQNGEMLITIRDTGAGIPEESLPHLFEKFYRVPGDGQAIQGTGLGLSICKRIIDVHHGRIEVESQENSGTTFTIYLPLDQATIAED